MVQIKNKDIDKIGRTVSHTMEQVPSEDFRKNYNNLSLGDSEFLKLAFQRVLKMLQNRKFQSEAEIGGHACPNPCPKLCPKQGLGQGLGQRFGQTWF